MAKNFVALTTALMELIAGAMLTLMMLLTFADVVGRYVFSAPVFGATEMMQFLMALIIFSGLAIANAHDDHIVVELFDHHIARLAPRLYRNVIQLFSIAAMAMLVYVLAGIAIESIHQGAKTIVLELPLGYLQATVAGFAAVSLVVQIVGAAARQASDTQHTLETTP